MQRGFDVRGRVEQRSDADGHPGEGARVSIRRPNARGLWFETEVATDLTGGFSFPGFLQRSAAGEEHAAPDSGWQLVCAGAVYELPERSDGPIDGIRVEVVIRREER
jgi:hypothetical protein